MKLGALGLAAVATLILGACMSLDVNVKPITLNVNFRIIDEKLDNFFAFEKKYEQSPSSQPASRPADNINSADNL